MYIVSLCAVISSLYHIEETGLVFYLDLNAIHFLDIVISDTLISMLILHCLYYPSKWYLIFYLTFLCPDMYYLNSRTQELAWRYPLFLIYLIPYLFLTRRYNVRIFSKKYFIYAILCNSAQFPLYFFAHQFSNIHYNYIHGLHHIFGFLSVLFYFKAIRWFPDVSNDRWISIQDQI